ncbi:hypothetical protein [Salisaeta longa]|uniref:hypothetical protein n=1 Tax=Salisaeta longa TaxID=503170 RepID=UPI0003B3CD71|nr:hypothetical protein [Salisaeta longa]
MPIDTLKAAKRLQEGGTFSPDQAERIAEILSYTDGASATVEDLHATEERLRDNIEETEARLNAKMEGIETQLSAQIDAPDAKVDGVGTRLEAKMSRVAARLEGKIDRVAARLMQRIELSEERIARDISNLRKDIRCWMLAGVSALAAFMTIVNYLMA